MDNDLANFLVGFILVNVVYLIVGFAIKGLDWFWLGAAIAVEIGLFAALIAFILIIALMMGTGFLLIEGAQMLYKLSPRYHMTWMLKRWVGLNLTRHGGGWEINTEWYNSEEPHVSNSKDQLEKIHKSLIKYKWNQQSTHQWVR